MSITRQRADFPKEIEAKLIEKAKQNHRSISAEVTAALEAWLTLEEHPQEEHAQVENSFVAKPVELQEAPAPIVTKEQSALSSPKKASLVGNHERLNEKLDVNWDLFHKLSHEITSAQRAMR